MTYDPISKTWKGNEKVLDLFKGISSTPPRPALITSKGSVKGVVQVSGDMCFDPQKFRWFGTSAVNDDDPFEGIADLEVEEHVTPAHVRKGINDSHFVLSSEYSERQQKLTDEHQQGVKAMYDKFGKSRHDKEDWRDVFYRYAVSRESK